MDFRKQLPPQRRPLCAPCDASHRAKQQTYRERLRRSLGKDPLMKDVEELRNTDEECDPMPVKRIDDALWRYRRQKHNRRACAKRTNSVRNQWKNMRERQN